MYYTIDRFEGEFAVVELEDSKRMVNIPKSALPQEAAEGDVIQVTIDRSQTQERRKKIESLLKDLFE